MSAPLAQTIAQGADLLARGDLAAAAQVANAHIARSRDPDALHLLALVRIQQERLEEAVDLLNRSLAARPGHPHVLLNLGKVLALMGRAEAATRALDEAVRLQPTLAEAWYELGELQQQAKDFSAAEASFRKVLALAPGHPLAQLSLGVTIKDDGRPAEAEPLLAEGLAQAEDPRLQTAFRYQMAFAQYDLGKKAEALANFTEIRRRDPGHTSLDFTRADLLVEMSRPDEAVALLADVLKREPGNDDAHKAYNNVIYQLGRDQEFLKSYDRVPPTLPLQLGKAGFLLLLDRAEEALQVYAGILRLEPGDLSGLVGAAMALNSLGRPGDAMKYLEEARMRFPGSAPVLQHMAATALQARDAKKAVSLAEAARKFAPQDRYGLALLGSAWRMAGDERDEILNGYDDLIRVFDLETPQGFSSMAQFNSALNDDLTRLHEGRREPAAQSLRKGSQTSGKLFSSRHELVDRLKHRIEEAVSRYIGELKPDAQHVFRRLWRAPEFRFAGSWSSRLKDCGYHVNHIHPEGWISSCYYIGVPDTAKDETAKQGWIKFGEPGFETGLGPRRAIQPVPGRLVLFPSYMWHGTIPFQSAETRTTIAFDAVPK